MDTLCQDADGGTWTGQSNLIWIFVKGRSHESSIVGSGPGVDNLFIVIGHGPCG